MQADGRARADKLQGLLYPHPEKLADFKSSISGDFNPYRLLAVVKFRDALITFEGHPDVSGPDKLCKMAVSLHKCWYQKASNTTKRKWNNIFNTCSTKRKDNSFDTWNALNSVVQPGYKFPRKGQSPATPQVTASSPQLPAAPTFEEGEEIEVHQLPKEDKLSKTLSSSMSFVDATSSTTAKAKVNYEFILFDNTGGQERLGMSSQTWNLFTEKLSDLVISRVFEDLPVPKIDWSNQERGIGVLAAVDDIYEAAGGQDHGGQAQVLRLVQERAGDLYLRHRKIAGDVQDSAVRQDHGSRGQAEQSPCGGLCALQEDDVQGSRRRLSPLDRGDKGVPGGLAIGRKGLSGDLLS